MSAQAVAIRHGITRALLQVDPELRPDAQEGRLHHARLARGRAQEVRPAQGAQAPAVLQALSPRCAACAPRRVDDRSRRRRDEPSRDTRPAASAGRRARRHWLRRRRAAAPARRAIRPSSSCSLSSEQYRGRRASEVYPFLTGIVDLTLAAPEDVAGVGGGGRLLRVAARRRPRRSCATSLADGRRALDMSADFRLRDPAVYARWYGPHRRRSSSRRRSTACRSCTATPCGARGWSRCPDAIPPAHCSGSHRSRVPGSSASR